MRATSQQYTQYNEVAQGEAVLPNEDALPNEQTMPEMPGETVWPVESEPESTAVAPRHHHVVRHALSRVFVCFIAAPLLWIVCKIWFGFDIDTSYERAANFNVRRYKGPLIFTPNHVQYLDESLVGMGVWPKIPHYVSMNQNFKIPVAGVILRMAETWTLGEKLSGLKKLSEKMRDAFAKGQSVCIYPEGMLVPYRKGLGKFHRGAFLASTYYHVPVVPIVLRQKPSRGIQRLRHKPSFTVVVGAPMYAQTQNVSLRRASFNLMHDVKTQMARMLKGPYTPSNHS